MKLDVERILVGVSLGADVTPNLAVTDLDRNAFDNAVWLARRVGAEIRLHHSIDWVGFDPVAAVPDLADAAREQASALLASLANEAREAGLQATHSVSIGPAWSEIAETADRWPADLIVIGPRAHSTDLLGKLTYGSTARKLARRASCGVWVVHPESGVGFEHPIFLVDLSPVSHEIVELGNWMRSKLEVTTDLLHCVDFPADVALHRLPNAVEAIRSYHQDVLQAADQHIDQLIGPDREGWNCDVADDWVVRVAPKLAESHGADLIVIAGTSKPGLAGKLLGSTAAKLLGRATTSTLIVKPRGESGA